MGFQTPAFDRLPAADADTVCAQRQALQSALDRADLLHVARDFRKIESTRRSARD
jgi:hypothetical protein